MSISIYVPLGVGTSNGGIPEYFGVEVVFSLGMVRRGEVMDVGRL